MTSSRLARASALTLTAALLTGIAAAGSAQATTQDSETLRAVAQATQAQFDTGMQIHVELGGDADFPPLLIGVKNETDGEHAWWATLTSEQAWKLYALTGPQFAPEGSYVTPVEAALQPSGYGTDQAQRRLNQEGRALLDGAGMSGKAVMLPYTTAAQWPESGLITSERDLKTARATIETVYNPARVVLELLNDSSAWSDVDASALADGSVEYIVRGEAGEALMVATTDRSGAHLAQVSGPLWGPPWSDTVVLTVESLGDATKLPATPATIPAGNVEKVLKDVFRSKFALELQHVATQVRDSAALEAMKARKPVSAAFIYRSAKTQRQFSGVQVHRTDHGACLTLETKFGALHSVVSAKNREVRVRTATNCATALMNTHRPRR